MNNDMNNTQNNKFFNNNTNIGMNPNNGREPNLDNQQYYNNNQNFQGQQDSLNQTTNANQPNINSQTNYDPNIVFGSHMNNFNQPNNINQPINNFEQPAYNQSNVGVSQPNNVQPAYNNNQNYGSQPFNNQGNFVNESNNTNNTNKPAKKGKGVATILFVVVLIIIGIVVVPRLFGGSASVGATANVGQGLKIKNKIYNLTISVDTAQQGVVYKNDGTLLSTFNLDGTYTKVKVTIKNNNSTDASLNSYIAPIYLMDSSKSKIVSCSYGDTVVASNLKNEKLPSTIPANSTVSGFVYCKTTSTAGTILNINIPSNASTNSSGGYSLTADEYYFNLS